MASGAGLGAGAPSRACGLPGAEVSRAERTDGGAFRAAHGPGPGLGHGPEAGVRGAGARPSGHGPALPHAALQPGPAPPSPARGGRALPPPLP